MNMYMYVYMYPSWHHNRQCLLGSSIHLNNEGLMDHSVELCISFVDSCTRAYTNTIEARWNYAKFTSGLTEKTRLNV